MPLQVKGEDGRIIHDQLSDSDAMDLAAKVHQNTGETVTLVPWRLNEGVYSLDAEMSETLGAPVAEAVELAEMEPVAEPPVEETDVAAEEAPQADVAAENVDVPVEDTAAEEPATE